MNPLMTKEDVCGVLAISMSTLNRILAAKELSYVIVGSRPRFRQEDIDRYLERGTQVARPVVQEIRAKNLAPSHRATMNNSGYYPGMKVV